MQSLLDTIARISARWRQRSSTVSSKNPRGTATRELNAGERWGKFQIISKLGRGSFGNVYHARDALDREVAIKILAGFDAIREAKLLARLPRHPNLVGVFACDELGDEAALSMELIRGVTLEQFVLRIGKLDPVHAALIARDLCRGLAVAHSSGLVHRDIKSTNAIRQQDGRVVLVDFGLGEEIDSHRLHAADLAGTLPYMAPELFHGDPASTRTDIYAMGVLLFYLVSGKFPLEGNSYSEFQKLHKLRQRQHLEDLSPGVPSDLVAVVDRAIQPSSARRFRSAGAMASALEGVIHSRKRRLFPTTAILRFAALVTVLATTVGTWMWLHVNRVVESDPELLRLTAENAFSKDPALSPDGTLLAYASDQGQPGNLDIWIKQVPDGSSVRLTKDPHDDWSPAFSPDGHWVAFRSERDGGGIYLVPTFGGEERLLARNAYNPRFSPDGKFISYWTGEHGHNRMPSGKLHIIPSQGGEPQQLASELADARYPIWAPDSRHILFQGSNEPQRPPDENADWWIVSITREQARNTGAMARFKSQGLEVHPDAAYWNGEFLVFAAAKKANLNIWRASFNINNFKVGSAHRLTVGSAVETTPWVADNGNMVFAQRQNNLRIWAFPSDGSENAMYRITNSADFDAFPSISRDGKWLAYTRTSSETGHREVWLKDLSSEKEIMVTQTHESKYNPMIAPDGLSIAFNIRENGTDSVHLVSPETRISHKVCSNCGVVDSWSRNGALLLTTANDTIQTVDIRSGVVTPMLTEPGFLLEEAEWSPDEKWMAFSARKPGQERQIYVASMSQPNLLLHLASGSGWADKPHWSHNGKWIYFYASRDGYPCIWRVRLVDLQRNAAHPVWPVQHFHDTRRSADHISQPVRGYAINRNQIFANLAETTGSVWMRSERTK
ncbi:MAG TPA: protein kinase [Candidatus Angelobacter sp.]|jgi:serine/threonine protein kinase|nr:protein kinase [Candidatus Angelobacter sp.]